MALARRVMGRWAGPSQGVPPPALHPPRWAGMACRFAEEGPSPDPRALDLASGHIRVAATPMVHARGICSRHLDCYLEDRKNGRVQGDQGFCIPSGALKGL